MILSGHATPRQAKLTMSSVGTVHILRFFILSTTTTKKNDLRNSNQVQWKKNNLWIIEIMLGTEPQHAIRDPFRAHLNIKVSGSVSFCKWEFAEGRKREQLFFVKKEVAEPKLRSGEVGNWTDLSCTQLSPHTRCLLYLEPLFPCVFVWLADAFASGRQRLPWRACSEVGGTFGESGCSRLPMAWAERSFHLLGFTNVTSHRVRNWQLFFHKSFQTQLRDPFCRSHLSGLTMMVCLRLKTPTAAPMLSCDYSSEGIDKAGCLTGCHWAPGSLRLHKLQTISLVSWKGPAPCSKHKEVCFSPSPTQTKWVELTRALLKPGLWDVRISSNLMLELLKMRLSLKMV